MARQTAEFKTVLVASAEDVFRWHWQPGTLSKLIPPWENAEIVRPAPGPEEGATAILRIALGPLTMKWIAVHCEIVPGRQFADVQKSGPFAYWHHLHKFEPIAADKCLLIDRIEYELPLSGLSQKVLGPYVNTKIRRMFEYRHGITVAELMACK